MNPTEVRRGVSDRVMRIVWDDDHQSEYPWAYLRGWCPCAACQGHGNEKRYVHAPTSDLASLSVVGNYALSLVWSDGHETGIYSYRHLRQLCHCSKCGGIGEGTPEA